MYTILESIGTANPPFKVAQSDAANFMSQIEGLSSATKQRMAAIYSRSGIDYRYSCLNDYGTAPDKFEFYPQNWSLQPAPTTAMRNQKYAYWSLEVAEIAVKNALQQSTIKPAEITHIITVSCTGFSAPGVDIHLIKRLGLAPTIKRTLIGFMGCNAAFNAMKIAHAICQSDDKARVLLVCIELCSLHFQIEDSLESVVINALFGDGAAAAILASLSPEESLGKLAYIDGYSLLLEDSLDLMTWNIGNTGFTMTLSPEIPTVIAQHLPGYLHQFLGQHHLKQEVLDFWAIHPGGRQIIDRIKSTLGLKDELVANSYQVLRQYGNMSSATILFILQSLMPKHQQGVPYQNGIALGFGPGVSIEGCLFQVIV